MKKIFIFFGCVVLCIGLYFAYNNVGGKGFDDSIQFIQRHLGGRGQLQDIQDDIGIQSIADLRWYDLGKKIEIDYGKVKLKVKKEDILTKDVVDKLKSVYIEYKYYEKTGEFKFYYHGEEIGKYVK